MSTALGYALARDLDGSDATIAALIGDASFTGGMALEALNDIGRANTPLLIVLNDNGMSISPNVGGFSAYLAKVRMSSQYTNLRNQVEDAFNSSGALGRLLMRGGNAAKESFKQIVLPGATFLEGFASPTSVRWTVMTSRPWSASSVTPRSSAAPSSSMP